MATPSLQRRWLLFGAVLTFAIFIGLAALRRASAPPAVNQVPAANISSATPADSRRGSSAAATLAVKTKSGVLVSEEAHFRAAANAALTIRDPLQKSREFGRALQAWLMRDLDGALAYVRQLTPGGDYTQGLLMTLDAIGQRDPDRALTLARDLAVTREQRSFYSAMFARLAAQDVPDAIQRLAFVPAGEGRANAIRAVTDAWSRTDRSAALAWAQALSVPDDRAAAIESLVAEVTVSDPLHAIELAQKFLTGPALDRTLFNAIHQLTEIDPAGAAAIARLLPAGMTQTLATADAARALAARNVAEALTWSAMLPAAELQQMAVNNVLDVWVQKDASAARQYVAQLATGAAQDVAAIHLGRILGASDPPAAIAWAQALVSDSAREAALVSIASAWAQKDAAAAARWASDFPTAAVQHAGLESALSYWILQDARAAREFVARLPAEVQVQAAATIAPALAQSDPTAALTWAQSLSLPAAREAAVAGAFARWLANAPAPARAWLASANLPPEVKSLLLAPR